MRNIYLILISFIFIGCNNQFNISSYLPKQINNNIQKKQTIAKPKQYFKKDRKEPCWTSNPDCIYKEYNHKQYGYGNTIQDAIQDAKSKFSAYISEKISSNSNSTMSYTKNTLKENYYKSSINNINNKTSIILQGIKQIDKYESEIKNKVYVLMAVSKNNEKYFQKINDIKTADNLLIIKKKKKENDKIELYEYQDENNNIVEIEDKYFEKIDNLLYEINYDLNEMQFDEAKNYCLALISNKNYSCSLPSINQISKYPFLDSNEMFNVQNQYKFWTKNQKNNKISIINLYNKKLFKNTLSKYKYSITKCICKKDNS